MARNRADSDPDWTKDKAEEINRKLDKLFVLTTQRKIPLLTPENYTPTLSPLISALPAATRKMDLCNGRLLAVPVRLFVLGEVLLSLDLSYNRLETLDPRIGFCIALQELNLSQNELLTELPVELAKLRKLVKLRLCNTSIQEPLLTDDCDACLADPMLWTVDVVCDWLEYNNHPTAVPFARRDRIDGAYLITLLKQEDWSTRGIQTLAECDKLIAEIKRRLPGPAPGPAPTPAPPRPRLELRRQLPMKKNETFYHAVTYDPSLQPEDADDGSVMAQFVEDSGELERSDSEYSELSHSGLGARRHSSISDGDIPGQKPFIIIWEAPSSLLRKSIETSRQLGELTSFALITLFSKLTRRVQAVHLLHRVHGDLSLDQFAYFKQQHLKFLKWKFARHQTPIPQNWKPDIVPPELCKFLLQEESIVPAPKFVDAIDFWQLGAMVYEIMCGTPIYPTDSKSNLIQWLNAWPFDPTERTARIENCAGNKLDRLRNVKIVEVLVKLLDPDPKTRVHEIQQFLQTSRCLNDSFDIPISPDVLGKQVLRALTELKTAMNMQSTNTQQLVTDIPAAVSAELAGVRELFAALKSSADVQTDSLIAISTKLVNIQDVDPKQASSLLDEDVIKRLTAIQLDQAASLKAQHLAQGVQQQMLELINAQQVKLGNIDAKTDTILENSTRVLAAYQEGEKLYKQQVKDSVESLLPVLNEKFKVVNDQAQTFVEILNQTKRGVDQLQTVSHLPGEDLKRLITSFEQFAQSLSDKDPTSEVLTAMRDGFERQILLTLSVSDCKEPSVFGILPSEFDDKRTFPQKIATLGKDTFRIHPLCEVDGKVTHLLPLNEYRGARLTAPGEKLTKMLPALKVCLFLATLAAKGAAAAGGMASVVPDMGDLLSNINVPDGFTDSINSTSAKIAQAQQMGKSVRSVTATMSADEQILSQELTEMCRAYVKEKDKKKKRVPWGGLRRVVFKDGHIHWVCAECLANNTDVIPLVDEETTKHLNHHLKH